MTPSEKVAMDFMIKRIQVLDERINKLEEIVENKLGIYIPKM